jgi:ribosomal protein eL8
MAVYVRFQVPDEVKKKILEAVQMAVETGKVRKGTNEVTKVVERNQAKFVVIAEDVQPPEVVAHLPLLCEEKGIPYGYVSSKAELGKRIGIKSAASAAIVDFGGAADAFKEIIEEISAIKK